MKKISFILIILSLLTLLVACGNTNDSKPSSSTDTYDNSGSSTETQPDAVEESDEKEEEPKKLVIYSGRKEKYLQEFVDEYKAATGVDIEVLYGSSNELGFRLIEEKNNVRADLYITTDAGILEFVNSQGVLESINEEIVKAVPSKYRAENNEWSAITARARVLIYNKDLTSPEELPKSVLEFADPKYQGEMAVVTTGNSSMFSHIAAVRKAVDDQAAEEWLRGIYANNGLTGNDSHGTIAKNVGSGAIKFGLVNDYYYHKQKMAEENNNVGIVYLDQEGFGTFVNVAGIGLVKGAENKDEAESFIKYILSNEGQVKYTNISKEVPIIPEVAKDIEYVEGTIEDYKVMDFDLKELGKIWDETDEFIAGLNLE